MGVGVLNKGATIKGVKQRTVFFVSKIMSKNNDEIKSSSALSLMMYKVVSSDCVFVKRGVKKCDVLLPRGFDFTTSIRKKGRLLLI